MGLRSERIVTPRSLCATLRAQDDTTLARRSACGQTALWGHVDDHGQPASALLLDIVIGIALPLQPLLELDGVFEIVSRYARGIFGIDDQCAVQPQRLLAIRFLVGVVEE